MPCDKGRFNAINAKTVIENVFLVKFIVNQMSVAVPLDTTDPFTLNVKD